MIQFASWRHNRSRIRRAGFAGAAGLVVVIVTRERSRTAAAGCVSRAGRARVTVLVVVGIARETDCTAAACRVGRAGRARAAGQIVVGLAAGRRGRAGAGRYACRASRTRVAGFVVSALASERARSVACRVRRTSLANAAVQPFAAVAFRAGRTGVRLAVLRFAAATGGAGFRLIVGRVVAGNAGAVADAGICRFILVFVGIGAIFQFAAALTRFCHRAPSLCFAGDVVAKVLADIAAGIVQGIARKCLHAAAACRVVGAGLADAVFQVIIAFALNTFCVGFAFSASFGANNNVGGFLCAVSA